MQKFILLLAFVALSKADSPMFEIGKEVDSSEVQQCLEGHSCHMIQVFIDAIRSGEALTIPDPENSAEALAVLERTPLEEEDTDRDHSWTYEDDQGNFMEVTLTKENRGSGNGNGRGRGAFPSVDASIHVGEKVFDIENCGPRCHILITQDVNEFVDELEGEEHEEHENVESLPAPMEVRALEDRAINYATIHFYYTTTLKNTYGTTQLRSHMDTAIAEANSAYTSGGINLRLVFHGMTEVSQSNLEGGDFGVILNNFKNLNQWQCLTRKGADAAALMVLGTSTSSCGIAPFNVVSSGGTLSVVKYSCATGYFSFAHEIAHNQGATHNVEVITDPISGHKYGELINKPDGTASGQRTIMGYSKAGYYQRINRFSSSSQTFNGNSLGLSYENNVAVINANAAAFANIAENFPCTCQDVGYFYEPHNKHYDCSVYGDSWCGSPSFQNACPVRCGLC